MKFPSFLFKKNERTKSLAEIKREVLVEKGKKQFEKLSRLGIGFPIIAVR